jgi:hypothetical protein
VLRLSLSPSFFALTGAICIGLSGCGDKEKPQSENDRNLQALSVLYGKYSRSNRGVGPPNEVEFRKYVSGLPQSELAPLNLNSSNVDSIFRSPRDNQPYGIAWNVRGTVPSPNSSGTMVIWEQAGVGGKRMVADVLGKIEEIDEATFNQRKAQISKS